MNTRLRLAILVGPRTQFRLAQLTNFGEGRLSKNDNGWVNPTELQRQAIADAQPTPVAELFGAHRTAGRSGGAAR